MNPYILFIPFVIMAGIIVYLLRAKKRLEEENREEQPLEKFEQSPVESIPESNTESITDLREQLSQFHQAMAQCPSSIIITDLDGNIEYVNTQFSKGTGYSMEEVLGRNPRFLKSGNMPPEIYEELWSTITAGITWRGELESRTKGVQLIWELVSIAPISDNKGNLMRYFAVKEDITEAHHREHEARRVRMEAEAVEAADQAKSVFPRVMGQEMKNPLNRVLGFTNLISQSKLTNEQLKQLNQVGGAGLELLALIDRILDFTSAETGVMELDREPFKPAEVIDQVLAVLGPRDLARI